MKNRQKTGIILGAFVVMLALVFCFSHEIALGVIRLRLQTLARHHFGAPLTYDELSLENKTVTIKNGKVESPTGKFSFSEARAAVHLRLKKREITLVLSLQQPLLKAPPTLFTESKASFLPFSSFFQWKVTTSVEGGELLLDQDNTLVFSLDHQWQHKHGEGEIILGRGLEMPSLKLHFAHTRGGIFSLSSSFQEEGFRFFAQTLPLYVNQLTCLSQWELKRGSLEGEVKFRLTKRGYADLTGSLKGSGVEILHRTSDLKATIDQLTVSADIALTPSHAIEKWSGALTFSEGKMLFQEREGIDMKKGEVVVKDGKIESSHFETRLGPIKDLSLELIKSKGKIFCDKEGVHIRDLRCDWKKMQAYGNVDLERRDGGIDVKIMTHSLEGPTQSAMQFLSHFIPSFFWKIPLKGRLTSGQEEGFFHLSFNPKGRLVGAHFSGELNTSLGGSSFGLDSCQMHFDYDLGKNRLLFSDGKGFVFSKGGKSAYPLQIPSMILFDFPYPQMLVEASIIDDQACTHAFKGALTGQGAKKHLSLESDFLSLAGSREERVFCLDHFRVGALTGACTAEASEKGLLIHQMQVAYKGLQATFQEGRVNEEGNIHLAGKVHFDGERASQFLPEKVRKYGVGGEDYSLEGDFVFSLENPFQPSFEGVLYGNHCMIGGIQMASLSADTKIRPGTYDFTHILLNNEAGQLSIDRLKLIRSDHKWYLTIPSLSITNFRPGSLKIDEQTLLEDKKSALRSLIISRIQCTGIEGILGNKESFTGKGEMQFSNEAPKNFASDLLMIPAEITARIGLDLSLLIPVKGGIDYEIRDGKIYLLNLDNVYSEGKRSRFYLAEGTPAYVDLDGNLHLQIKMKQYNLLMKLAELFTISVRGTVSKPNYTLTVPPEAPHEANKRHFHSLYEPALSTSLPPLPGIQRR